MAFEIEQEFDAARGGIGSDRAHAASNRTSLSPPAPSVTADAVLPGSTGPAIHIDLDALANRIAEKLQAPQPPATEAAMPTAGPAKAKTIQQVYDAYMADPGVIRSGKTVLAYETVFGLLIEIIGQDTPLSDIGRETCREVMDTLRWLPPNSTKRYPNLTAREIAQKARDAGKASGLSPATVNGYMTKLSALLTWAVNEGFIDRNPAKGLGVVDTTNRKDKRQPFTPKQLQAIFTAPLYTGCQDDDYGYAKPGDARPRRGRFWVPLIGLFAGMRLNEICQMNTEDVRVIDSTLCFVVTAEAIKGTDDKRLKTGSSERVIPVHPMLLAAGFEDYVSEQRRKRNAKLFPELTPAKTGYYSDIFSKWFRRFLQKTGASAGRTCFHSFRHNFRDALREARVDRELALALGGWAGDNGDMGSESAEFYGRGFRASTLLEAISKVSYPELNLGHLLIAPSPA
ncbi:tyrosine-type recombinase/integrase [Skermanella rosea]|uniref:site-specific integrase n=1 Tax=Skermanella rosea TaxID=1817965 RepID=UPI001E5BEE32|nr:tyrosine-type recombinase/integrase [Skermanella rosea]